jgi:hypothetical protein
MRTRNATITAAVVTLAAATLVGTATGSGAAAPAQHFTLGATTTHETLLDLGTAEDPTGSQFVSAHDLSRGEKMVGHDGASCQIIDVVGPEQLRVQCVASLSLPQGQLTAQGLNTVSEDDSTPLVLAITGGTGRYTGAAGKIVVSQLDQQHNRYIVTLRN